MLIHLSDTDLANSRGHIGTFDLAVEFGLDYTDDPEIQAVYLVQSAHGSQTLTELRQDQPMDFLGIAKAANAYVRGKSVWDSLVEALEDFDVEWVARRRHADHVNRDDSPTRI